MKQASLGANTIMKSMIGILSANGSQQKKYVCKQMNTKYN